MSKSKEPAVEFSALLSSPLIRIAIAIVVLVSVAVCVVAVAYNAALTARRKPIEVELYPGAELEAQEDIGRGQDRLLYITTDAAESVVDFYRARYDKNDDQTCKRHDAPCDCQGTACDCAEAPEGAPLFDPTQPAFEVACNIDKSIINAQQSALIIIQPHTTGPYAGHTVIDIRRTWQE